MKTLTLVALALLISTAAVAGTIRGTVTSGGAALPAMIVAAYTSAGTLQASGATTTSGTYALTVPAGTYRVLAYDPNGVYATSFFDKAPSFETSTAVAVSSSTITINFSLVVAGHIAGHVTSLSAIQLSNVTVAAYNLDGTRRGFTSPDASGAYGLTLPPGTYKLIAFDATLTYAPEFYANQNSFANATPINVTTQTITIDLQLDPAATLSGKVTDHVTGAPLPAPLPGITVAAYNGDGTLLSSTLTDSAGAYLLGVPTGDYRIGAFDTSLFYLKQFYPNATLYELGTVVHAVASQNVNGLNLALTRGARITGRAIDQSTAKELSGITIGAYDASGHLIHAATTDATGNYVLLLWPATYKLVAFDTALQYATAYYQNAASFDSTATLPLIEGQSLAADFAMPLAGRISGIVTDASTGRAIAATMIAYDANGVAAASTIADPNGAFRLALLPGSYRIAATDPNHVYSTVFFDASATFETAASINVAAAQEFSGVALRMHVAAATFRRRAAKH